MTTLCLSYASSDGQIRNVLGGWCDYPPAARNQQPATSNQPQDNKMSLIVLVGGGRALIQARGRELGTRSREL